MSTLTERLDAVMQGYDTTRDSLRALNRLLRAQGEKSAIREELLRNTLFIGASPEEALQRLRAAEQDNDDLSGVPETRSCHGWRVALNPILHNLDSARAAGEC